ncbi:MAG: hypothetical protein KGJ52_12060, partial [Gammaproteobacteria bacterium]|nr:hypothetical protein [Gammaproteobacteria bacterium]
GMQLDAAGRYVVRLDAAGRPASVHMNGQPLPIVPLAASGGQAPAPGVQLAPAHTPLRQIVELCSRSGHPVLLQQDGRLCGACGEAEILRALAGSYSATVVPGAAG